MSSLTKKNHNEDTSDEEYLVSEFSHVFTSSSNDGKTIVSSGGTQRIRESFHTHFNAVPFGFFNENVAAGGTNRNTITGTMTATRNEKAAVAGTTPGNAETGAPTATRNEKAAAGTTRNEERLVFLSKVICR